MLYQMSWRRWFRSLAITLTETSGPWITISTPHRAGCPRHAYRAISNILFCKVNKNGQDPTFSLNLARVFCTCTVQYAVLGAAVLGVKIRVHRQRGSRRLPLNSPSSPSSTVITLSSPTLHPHRPHCIQPHPRFLCTTQGSRNWKHAGADRFPRLQ